ncbi:SIS domain-containing protein [Lacimicrobium alkaliphilum]|uniref:Tagatose-6-phosphate ketose isomerase n=1 Tax=Lacimicrobium alkaliphilum TaxID=1526571 RepID=A0ABQ1RJF5_9ALTE|nr:SIS domain-containing protein [Lacimicrobium alkaliphilum]GGD69698.1 tagatose-6-phosphate ketose isomerase [Lacimicrobium alkaliphilum]
MTDYLSISQDMLKQKKAFWTAREIQQQPQVWAETVASVDAQRQALAEFLNPILALDDLRIIFSGAGTSAYVGDAVVPYIRKTTGLRAISISTTDIVATPQSTLNSDVPTLLVSFGRSGSSPESVAAVEITEKVVKRCFHLIVTCNPQGQLAIASKEKSNAYTLLMPKQALDQSFAMTSSFTSMLLASLAVFSPVSSDVVDSVIRCADNILKKGVPEIQALANKQADRIVFLGAGSLTAIAKEAALKCLELTAGKKTSYFETPLGFRHGPKSLVNPLTSVLIFPSLNTYTRAYDDDLLAELQADGIAQTVVSVDLLKFGIDESTPDVLAGLPYIVFAQILSFFQSLKLGLSPDNPCPTGEVNRVVQGVKIHSISECA